MKSYEKFSKWLNTRKTVDVLVMDGAEILVDVKKAKIMIAPELNGSGYPRCMKVIAKNVVVNIGGRYINHIIETGEYWSVFVDGYENYLFSK
jgi:hypothetical protein